MVSASLCSVRQEAEFTFNLSRPAVVVVKVFTIAGRRVATLPERLCGFGYNQVHWNGCDDRGVPVPNGVYLFKVDARATGVSGLGFSASYRDRLLVQR